MQPELKERLETAAKASGRSLNAEIVHRLEQSLTTSAPVKVGNKMIEISNFDELMEDYLRRYSAKHGKS